MCSIPTFTVVIVYICNDTMILLDYSQLGLGTPVGADAALVRILV